MKNIFQEGGSDELLTKHQSFPCPQPNAAHHTPAAPPIIGPAAVLPLHTVSAPPLSRGLKAWTHPGLPSLCHFPSPDHQQIMSALPSEWTQSEHSPAFSITLDCCHSLESGLAVSSLPSLPLFCTHWPRSQIISLIYSLTRTLL